MNQRRKDRKHTMGHLPDPAPLANPYVPFQQESPPKYDARRGLIRGTVYPGLDLPFMGMVNNREKPVTPLSELQALYFAVTELALYLDTHRDDREALEQYRAYQKRYEQCLEEYRRTRGPMNHTRRSDTDGYSWLDDPWPWEYAANKEG